MLDQVARHGMIDLDIDAKGDLHIDAHTRSRISASRSARPSPRRSATRPGAPLRPRLRAARRGAVARGARLFRPSRARVPREVHARPDRRVRRRSDARVLPGLRQPCARTLHIDNLRGDNAHHQCETMFKASRARCAWRPSPIRAPPAPFLPPRGRSGVEIAVVDYGMGNLRSVSKALEHVAPKPRCLTADLESIRGANESSSPVRARSPTACAACASGAREAVVEATAVKPFLGICIGLQMLFERGEEGTCRPWRAARTTCRAFGPPGLRSRTSAGTRSGRSGARALAGHPRPQPLLLCA